MSTANSKIRWFSVPRPQPEGRFNLFCFPYAGGGASCFFQWARSLAEQAIEVRSVQLPGRENRLREAPIADMHVVVGALADAMEPLLAQPYGFWGHSMGATIAYEVARELRRRGHYGPAVLVASGSGAPQLKRVVAPLHELPDDVFVHQVSQRYGGIPAAVLENKELLELVLPTVRADMALIERYEFRAGDKLMCPIHAYGGVDDDGVTPAKLERWQEVTDGTFSMQMFEGGHFFLNDHRDLLTERLVEVIERQGIRPGA
jgi:medium-chain acyl-[acyl-carrier-protein] hydrolase